MTDHATWALFGEAEPPSTTPTTPTPSTPDTTTNTTHAEPSPPVATRTQHRDTARPLIALAGGPKDGHWYWLTDWQRHLRSVHAQHFSPDHPACAALHYHPTGHHVAHTNPAFKRGEMWRFTPPEPAPDKPVTTETGEAEDSPWLMCPRCHRPAPRLIVVHLAGRPDPIVDCPRCAYPDLLELSSRVPTMPAADREWYAARVLVTGSRTWHDTATITAALTRVRHRWPGATLVHGAADGADQLAAGVWRDWGLQTEAHPADWTGPCSQDCPPGHRRPRRGGGSYCPKAGRRRNAAMVAAGANVCVAFIHNHSRGASHCADLAQTADIPTWRHHATTPQTHQHTPNRRAA